MFSTTKEKVFFIILIVLAVLLVISNVFTVYYLFHRNDVVEPDQRVDVVVPTVNDNSGDVSDVDATNENEASDVQINEQSGQIEVTWNEFPNNVTVKNFFPYNFFNGNDSKLNEITNMIGNITDAGKITSGVYRDSHVYLVESYPDGMALSNDYFWVIDDRDSDQMIILDKYSMSPSGAFLQSLFVYNKELTIKNWAAPETIDIPGSTYKLKRSDMRYTRLLSGYTLVKQFKYDDDNYLYWDELSGCFVVKRPGNTAQDYYVDIDFLNGNRESRGSVATSQVMNFRWNDGTKNTTEYQTTRLTGCGASGCYSYPDDLNPNDLIKAGTTDRNGNLYAYSPTTTQDSLAQGHKLLDTYSYYYPGFDEGTGQQNEKESFSKFMSEYPLLYWRDPFGRWMEFLNVKYQPAVECGKPVIYLYPEEEMSVDVKVEPTGGIKISEPNYGDGWSVTASTDGTLFNLADKQSYPYLFWEGYGYKYAQPDRGYVVKQTEVKSFLQYILKELGLNEKESADFNEFWVAKMQEKPYYFITFLPQGEFDKIAPLTIEPQAATVIRVFMDYKGLDEFQDVEPLSIRTPKRKGFTVVEWGGALHD